MVSAGNLSQQFYSLSREVGESQMDRRSAIGQGEASPGRVKNRRLKRDYAAIRSPAAAILDFRQLGRHAEQPAIASLIWRPT